MIKNKNRIIFIFIAIIFSFTIGCEREKKPLTDRCDYDGTKIVPLYAVYFTLQDGTEKKYCSIVCASMSFQELKGRIKEVVVVDEPSGKKINASDAFFVESEVVTVPHVSNRIHTFGNKEDAAKHVQRFNGRWVENPFR